MATPDQLLRHSKNPTDLQRARDYLAHDPARSGMGRLRKAICDPVRLEIIRALGSGRLCVTDLALAIHRAPAATSQHLRVLRELDLVSRDRQGTTIYYSLNKATTAPLQRVFQALAAVQEQRSA